ncbi:MAG: flagellar hook-basal body complex protein, partial [Methylocystis sp.]|nr:flagellar hook-basal body complex protein [Methylocystis sp.]
MHSAFYVSLSSQLALEKRIATIAENVANAGTIGYRATGVSFDSVLSNRAVAHGRASGARTTYASAGADYISRESGSLVKTDNPFDVGLTGNAWLAIRTPQGVAYTRDGRMKMLETGELQTIL